MTHARHPATPIGDQALHIERGADGRYEVVLCSDGQQRRVDFADFVAAERRHALALRQAAIDRAATGAALAFRRLARRLRRRLIVAAGHALRAPRAHWLPGSTAA